jgi:RNA polymerase sigma-70 factor (ECF subfamily)
LPAPADRSTAYFRFYPPILAKCRRLLGGSPAAVDVAQEAFLRLWRSDMRAADDPRATLAWLYRTCTRLAIDHLRQRPSSSLDAEEDCDLACAVDLAARLEARAAIRALVGSLDAEEVEVAVLCRVDGLSQPEAAEVLGVTERTVRRRLERFDRGVAARREELAP